MRKKAVTVFILLMTLILSGCQKQRDLNIVPLETAENPARQPDQTELITPDGLIAEPGIFYKDGYAYTLHTDGTAVIRKYNRTGDSSITIPEVIDNHPVTGIEDYAFEECEYVKNVTIPDSITYLGANPFRNCTRLTSILVSPSHPTLATIDGVLFDKTEKKLICYPDKAMARKRYTIPDGIRSIGDSAFYNCDSLSSVSIPQSVEGIGGYAFALSSSLKKIEIMGSIAQLGPAPFRGCYKLTDISVSAPSSVLFVMEGMVINLKEQELIFFFHTDHAQDCAVPQGTRSIGPYAFNNCTSLKSVILPDTVTAIGDYAFHGCTELNHITMSENVESIGDYAFDSCEKLPSVHLPEALTHIGNYAFHWCQSLTDVHLPSQLVFLGRSAFEACYKITGIVIPDKITVIEPSTFKSCMNLRSVQLPQDLTSIGNSAFSECFDLSNITIPGSVTIIGSGAFQNCDSIYNLSVPESVTAIGSKAFYSCNQLRSITLPASVSEIGNDAFSENKYMTITVLPDTFAAQWCQKNLLNFQYPSTVDWLNNNE